MFLHDKKRMDRRDGRFHTIKNKVGKPAGASQPLTHEGLAHFGAAAMPLCGYIPYRGMCIPRRVLYNRTVQSTVLLYKKGVFPVENALVLI